MTFGPVTVGPGTSLSQAIELMREKGFEVLPVVENGDVKGIITAWDFLRMALHQDTVDPGQVTVCQVMSTKVMTVSADEIIEEAAFIMREHDVWALPVVN
ncbi:MAG: CBS domain-containing protein, partial [Thermodesulfobacteriota bacterium]